MASISKDRSGRKRLLYVDGTGARRSIYLGKITVADAREIKTRVECILSSKTARRSFDNTTALWIEEIPEVLASKLSKHGLIPPRERLNEITMEGHLSDYFERRNDVKAATKIVWKHAANDLKGYFSAGRKLADISEGDADNFKLHLLERGLAPATIQKRLQVVRMFFKSAVRQGVVDRNVFLGVSVNGAVVPDRKVFVSREDCQRIMDACDPTWKTIVALSRYGGLRCPSEVLSLRWEGVDWIGNRIVVDSPKTEHHPGGAQRVMPFFPELKPILEEAYELALEGAEYVVGGGYRERALAAGVWKNCNLRTQFYRILRRAGVAKFPKPFNNLRSSRETELAEKFPIQVASAWIGNTPKIALKHYLQVTDDHFRQAAEGSAESSALLAQNAAQHPHADNRNDQQETKQAPAEQGLVRRNAVTCQNMQVTRVAGTGFEPATSRL